ncbi:MAG: DNA polymerase III subunit delta' [Steroidobacteraceae bacterium]
MSPSQANSTRPDRPIPWPWHLPIYTQLNRSWQLQRLPHALLLHGVAGLGKYQFAQWLAHAVLCERDAQSLMPCGDCVSCKLNQAGSHPDLLLISPEDDKQQISVDQIRVANERLNITSTRNGYRVAIVEPAHQMTNAAANSLLKTLEEPGTDSLIILVTSQAASLLATLRSRCQQLGMAVPTTAVAQAWLQDQTGKSVSAELLRLAGGAPLRAMAYAEASFEHLRESMSSGLGALSDGSADLTQLAQAWADEHLIERLHWLDYWLAEQIQREVVRNADPVTRQSLHGAAQVLNISPMFLVLDKLRELKVQLRRTALQRELALVTILAMVQHALHART